MFLTLGFILLVIATCMWVAHRFIQKTKADERVIDLVQIEKWDVETLNTTELLILIDHACAIYEQGVINRKQYHLKINYIAQLIEKKLFTAQDTLTINDCLPNPKSGSEER